MGAESPITYILKVNRKVLAIVPHALYEAGFELLWIQTGFNPDSSSFHITCSPGFHFRRIHSFITEIVSGILEN